MKTIKRILITPGEPAGIGPDITIHLAQHTFPAELIVIADPELLIARAKQIGLPLRLIHFAEDEARSTHQPGTLKIIPVKLNEAVIAGKLAINNANYVLETLKIAATLCQKKIADAIVTGPVNKAVMNDAGIAFTGHTEFFADAAGVKQTVMLFVADKLKVALATTHLPLNQVAKNITPEKLRTTLSTLQNGLQNLFGIQRPRILVCGLNPHAGENGHLGREEIEIISPVIQQLQQENMQISGPFPADTIFTPPYLAKADVILAMYHDQALPLVKYIGFGRAVNVTLGLPYVRTSVDHGTALDIAGTDLVDAGSMEAAIKVAIEMLDK